MEKMMATLYIDGKPYEVEQGKNLLEVILSLGLNLPYFCWHPALGSVGACRQCAVKSFKDEKEEAGSLVMACMTPLKDGMHISIKDPEAVEFRASVIEWLMENHPHDCPVCDEGGECHLQDMTVMTGHNYREYRFPKRTYHNQYLGPLINHEMNRCIQCYRCVRFYKDYAGGTDFNVFGSHDEVYFGRAVEGPLENEFSGNLIEVCPTGVFTDKTFKKHFTRKWDLQTAPSICANCGLGCNTIPGERYGTLRRIRNRYNFQVNGYFLCDRGRFGYEFVNSELRIRQPLLRKERGTPQIQSSPDEVLSFVVDKIKAGKRTIGIGSPRASLEANQALKEVVGKENFYMGVSRAERQLLQEELDILQHGPARTPSMKEAEHSDAILILGEDLTNTAPRLALSLRQIVHRRAAKVAEKYDIPDWNDAAIREVIQHEKETVFILNPTATKLDDVAIRTYHAVPDDLARLGFAIAHLLDSSAPVVDDLNDEESALVTQIADCLKNAERPLVVSGTSCGSQSILQASANIAWALCKNGLQGQLLFTVPEPNSLGLTLLGGGSLDQAFDRIRSKTEEMILILENDLYRRADPEDVDAFFTHTEMVVILDHLENEMTPKADAVLPASTFAESTGTYINNEGRAQRFFQVFIPEGKVQSSAEWLSAIRDAMGTGKSEGSVEENWLKSLVKDAPIFQPVVNAAPPPDFRMIGQKIPRQSHRYSGRTSMQANIAVSEPKPPDDPDSPLAYSMEGFEGQPPAGLIPRFWSPGWNSVQSVNKFQAEVGGALRDGDPGTRLIEPAADQNPAYFTEIPARFLPQEGNWLVVPLFHIFGSEELSVKSKGIAELAPTPYLAVNPEDARKIHVKPGDKLTLKVNNRAFMLPLKLDGSLPQGAVGYPVGLTGMQFLESLSWAQIESVENHE
jgi:NADH-quinone oxidoreductase subunit G